MDILDVLQRFLSWTHTHLVMFVIVLPILAICLIYSFYIWLESLTRKDDE